MSELTPARVVTFGELLLRLSPPAGEALGESGQLSANFGGAEANVAVGLAHLGVPVTYVTALPAAPNPLAAAARAALAAEGVELHAFEVKDSRLGLFFVDLGHDSRPPLTLYDRKHSAFAGVTPSNFPWLELLPGAGWFHCTGITPALGSGPAAALHAAVQTARYLQVPVSVDLNYRPALWGNRDPRELVVPLAEKADLLIANEDSLRAMVGLDTADPRRVAQLSGARRVAVTRRVVDPGGVHEWSASYYDGHALREVSSDVYRIRAVDRVGSGDSFSAALLFGIREGHPPDVALHRAVVAGAHKLFVPGDWNRMGVEQLVRLAATPDPSWS